MGRQYMKKYLIISAFLFATPVFADAPGAKLDQTNSNTSLQMASGGGNSAPDPHAAMPLERAKGEKLATAIGHYARARSLLIAAVREFDQGLKLVDPSALLDSGVWRTTLIDRADELQRVLDPQPRATKTGIKYQADSRLLGEAKK